MQKTLHKAVYGLEMITAVILVVMIALGVVNLVREIVISFTDHPFLRSGEILAILDTVLVIFIVIELFHIAIAYMKQQSVIPTVFEAALVAVVRKVVVFEAYDDPLPMAAALAVMTIAVAVSWFLLRRAGVMPASHVRKDAESKAVVEGASNE